MFPSIELLNIVVSDVKRLDLSKTPSYSASHLDPRSFRYSIRYINMYLKMKNVKKKTHLKTN